MVGIITELPTHNEGVKQALMVTKQLTHLRDRSLRQLCHPAIVDSTVCKLRTGQVEVKSLTTP